MKTNEKELPFLVQDYFTRFLYDERGLSERSVAAYRDAMLIFLRFTSRELKKSVTALECKDLTSDLVIDFLQYLEVERNNSVKSRNHRLAMVKSFARYVSYRKPEFMGQAQRLLAIPRKRTDSLMLGFLSRDEMSAVLGAIDQGTEAGRRDFDLFQMMYNTGMRVSETISVKSKDINFGKPSCIKINGKGRKQRQVPLWPSTAKVLRRRICSLGPDEFVFKNRMSEPMSRSGVESRLKIWVKKAKETCPSIASKKVSPHTIRHTTAMHLLESGVDISMIALWLGHSRIKTTHGYIEADLQMKAKALELVQDPKYKGKRFKAKDGVIEFLSRL